MEMHRVVEGQHMARRASLRQEVDKVDAWGIDSRTHLLASISLPLWATWHLLAACSLFLSSVLIVLSDSCSTPLVRR